MPSGSLPSSLAQEPPFDPRPRLPQLVAAGSRPFARALIGAAAAAFFLAVTLARLDVPLAEWDHVILDAAQAWSRGEERVWLFDHPPLYPGLLAVAFRLFGAGAEVARAVNAAFVLLTAFAVFRFAARIWNADAALWAFVLYLLNPVGIQGVCSLDMADTSVLPLLFLLSAAALRDFNARPTCGRMALLGLWVMICLWAKITSTVAWIAAVGLGLGLIGCFDEPRRLLRQTLGLAVGGLIGLAGYLATSFVVLSGMGGMEAFLFPLKSAVAAVTDRGWRMCRPGRGTDFSQLGGYW